MHGGGTPSVRAKAELRIAAAVDPAISYLIKAANQKKINAAGITAARDLLDRAGFKPIDRTELSGSLTLQQSMADTIRAKRQARLTGGREAGTSAGGGERKTE
jgi:hypothetical protein